MTAKSAAELIEEWQTGMIIVIGCLYVGYVGSFLFRPLPVDGMIGFAIGVVVAFLLASLSLARR
jgi:hypothetical protein